jgi:ATP-dependent Clp protease ATP-binding subunit ClpC
LWTGLSFPARLAIAATLEASLDLGHNYLGCEHLLIGLLSVTDSEASRVLRSFGVDRADAQRSVTTAIAGFVHARQTSATSEAGKLDEISRRLDDLERRLGPVAS